MNQALESFLASITSQGALDFNKVLIGVLFYLIALWFTFCLWVFFDSRRRFHNMAVAAGVTVLVFLLNFPALILYLIVRPEEDFHHVETGYNGKEYLHGGVEVPIIKFTDKDGDIKLSLNLKVNSNWNPASDMNVEVAWDSDREDISVERPQTRATEQNSVAIVKDQVTTRNADSKRSDSPRVLAKKLYDLREKAKTSVAQSFKSKKTKTESSPETKSV